MKIQIADSAYSRQERNPEPEYNLKRGNKPEPEYNLRQEKKPGRENGARQSSKARQGSDSRQSSNIMTKRGARLLAVCLCLLLAVSFCAACGTDGDPEESFILVEQDPGSGEGQEGKAIEGVPLGQWQDSCMLSERDGKPYPVQVRFTAVDRDAAEVQEQIDAYNVSAAGHTVPELPSETYAYAIAHYEVKFPGDYPDSDFGITNVAPAFTITAADGGDVIRVGNVSHEGLTDTFEIGALPQGYDFYSGSTYKGAIIFIMVNGYDDFRIREASPAANEAESQHYYMPY